jgi:HSP20 family protein
MDFKRLITFTHHPVNHLERIQRDFQDLFTDLWKNQESAKATMPTPVLDIEETEKEISIHVELPGLDEKDISIEMHHHILVIKGEKKIERTEDNKNYHVLERTSGFFSRSIQLPETIAQDANILASFKNGVLSITLTKQENSENKIRKIDISSH